MKRTAVIMAGGSGERFWPLSRRRKPKQLLKLNSEKTMLEESIDRISTLIPPEDVYIITGRLLLEPIRQALTKVPPENVIAEPAKRNTAPCLALAAAFIAEKYSGEFEPDEISIAVLTADQNISPVEGFAETVESALTRAEEGKELCIIGIKPARPETGYGYIEAEDSFSGSNLPEIKKVLRFREKPDAATAIQYLQSGNYLWNSGMFFWRLDTFIEGMKRHIPEIGEQIAFLRKLYRKKTSVALPDALDTALPLFEKFPDISIDYALMEKAGNVVVAKALFSWDDIGSWDSFERIKPKDENGNVEIGAVSAMDSRDSIIINSSSNSSTIVTGLGIDGMVVVVTDDAVMICPKSRVQEVRKCVDNLKIKNLDKWL